MKTTVLYKASTRGAIPSALSPSSPCSFGSSSSSWSTTKQHFSTKPKNNSKTNVMDFAQSYINSIRLKIAKTLTSSMEEQDRQQLFTSLNIQNKSERKEINNGGSTSQHEEEQEKQKEKSLSIGEAVAAALAKEASKQKSLLEQEKIAIFEQAEKAALERVQNDLLIKERKLALLRWKKELEEEKKAELAIHANNNNAVNDNVIVGEEEEKKGEVDVHPILGKVIMDFGYKRIHVISCKKLAAIPIWEKQRVYRHDRAKVMAKDKLKSMELGLPGVVALHENIEGELSIIDGQHRVGMLAILQAKKSKESEINPNIHNINNNSDNYLDLDQILVEVFPQTPSSSSTHAQDIFIEINKAEPVKLVDMPGIAKSTDRRIINDAAAYLEEKYPEMFKPSQRCRAPHLNIDNLRDAIFASGLLKKHNIQSKTALVKWILARNEELALKYDNDDGEGGVAATVKARKFDFYLGLDSSWLNH